MQYTNQSKRNIPVIALLAIFIVAMYNWFVTPQTRFLASAREFKRTVEAMKRASIVMSKTQKLSRKKLRECTEKFEQQKQSLFDADQTKDFLANLQSVAEESGCVVLNLKHLPVKETVIEDNNSVSIHFYRNQVNTRLLARYENIVGFLNTLQNRTAKVWIDSINISMKDVTGSYLICDTTLSIHKLDVKEIDEWRKNQSKRTF